MTRCFRFPWAVPLAAGLALLVAACSPQNNNDTDTLGQDPYHNQDGTDKVFAEFEPGKQVMPLPNDVVWLSDGTKEVSFDVPAVPESDLDVLKTIINGQELLGLSPNMFLTVPVTGAVDVATTKVFVFRTDDPNLFALLGAAGAGDTDGAIAAAAAMEVRTEADFVIVPGDGVVKLLPKSPFAPGTAYAVAVKHTLTDANGNLVDSSMAMAALKSRTPFTPDHPYYKFEALRAGFNDPNPSTHAPGLLDIVAAATGYRLGSQWTRDNVLLLWTFHTANRTLALPTAPDALPGPLLYAEAGALPAQLKAASRFGWTGHGPEWLTDTGSPTTDPIGVDVPTLLTDLTADGAPQDVIDAVGFAALYASSAIDKVYSGRFASANFATLALPSPTPVTVPFLLVTPKSGPKPYPVVVFQHGITRNRFDALFTANAFAQAGLAVLAIDAPNHGDRYAGEAFFTTNLLKDRANFYQAAFDLWETFDLLEENEIDLDDNEEPDLSASDVRFASQSLGSIIGSVFLAQDSRPYRIHLASPAAQLANVVDATTRPDISGLVTGLGYEKGTTSYYVFLDIVQWLLDPIDGTYNGVGENSADKIIAVSAYGDPTVSEASSFAFYAVSGLGGVPPSLAPSFAGAVPSAGAYRFGTAESPVIHFFTLAPVFNPETEPWYAGYSGTVQQLATAAAQAQVAAFFAPVE